MKPGRLIRMTDNRVLQEPQIPSGLIKKGISVPRGGTEIPEVRGDEEEYPEQKKSGFRIYQRP